MEIIEILRKCCCNMKFLPEIAFYHLVSAIKSFLSCYSVNLGNISSIYKSFEQIHHDTAPLICEKSLEPDWFLRLCFACM